MCGRYTLTQVGPRLVGERFELGEAEIEPATLGRFNVCPTEDILVVTHKGPRAVRWGLVPSYAKTIDGPLMINARAESVASKKVFARLLERPERRCLVIADGWYEWLKSEKKGEPRVPFRYTIDGGELFAFAGLCDVAKIDGEWVPVGDDPHHDRQRDLGARPRPHAGRARRPRRGGRVDAGRRPRAARADRQRAHLGGPGEPRRQQGGRRRSGADRRARGLSFRAMPTRLLLLTVVFLLALAVPASAVIVPGKGMAGMELGDCIERSIEVLGPPDKTFGKTDVFGFVETYTYVKRGLKLEFRRGPGECLVMDSIRTTKAEERTKEGVGKGTTQEGAAQEAQGREVPDVQAAQEDHASAGSAR